MILVSRNFQQNLYMLISRLPNDEVETGHAYLIKWDYTIYLLD